MRIQRQANTDLEFSPEQAMILDSSKDFCRDKSDIATVRKLIDSRSGFDADTWQEMIELGWTGIAIPEQYGGSGMSMGAVIPLVESMGRHLLCTPLLSTTLSAQALIRGASEQQKTQWLNKVADGSAIGTLALLDNEDWGATVSKMQLNQSANGLQLTGKKTMVMDAEVADFFIVSATANDTQTLVIVESKQLAKDAIKRKVCIDETKRVYDIEFTGVVVDQGAVLSNSLSTLKDIQLLGALLIASEASGAAAAALDCIVGYLTTRTQFGRLIGSFQALKHPTVEILMEMDAARTLIYHAATLLDHQGPGATINEDTEVACRMAKAQASEALLFAGDRAVQFHGGMGFTHECDAQLYLRRSQWSQQQFGDPQHHRRHLAPLLID